MGQTLVQIRDRQQTVHSRVAEDAARRLVAALSADPDELDELDTAERRFHRRAPRRFFKSWSRGGGSLPLHGAAVCIDLAARLIGTREIDWLDSHHGTVRYCDRGTVGADVPFHLAQDWCLTDRLSSFDSLAQQRRERSFRNTEPDRQMLLQGLPGDLARALSQHADRLVAGNRRTRRHIIRDIHAEWLLTAHRGLAGAAPREIMIDQRRKHVDLDVQHQSIRWSMLNEAPPPLARHTRAYRSAGFGSQEIVLMYDLVRAMLQEGIERLTQSGALDVEAASLHLAEFGRNWWHGPQEELANRTPADIVDHERMRLPEIVSDHSEMLHDDCPICQLMAEGELGIGFWFLDSSHMDTDFAFSFAGSYTEWEAEQETVSLPRVDG